MSTTNAKDDDAGSENHWEPGDEEHDAREIVAELTLDADDHTPEEAGYGYGV